MGRDCDFLASVASALLLAAPLGALQADAATAAIERAREQLASADPDPSPFPYVAATFYLTRDGRSEEAIELAAAARAVVPDDDIYEVTLVHRQIVAAERLADWERARGFLGEAFDFLGGFEGHPHLARLLPETEGYALLLAMEMGLTDRAHELAGRVVEALEARQRTHDDVKSSLRDNSSRLLGALLANDRYRAVVRRAPEILEEWADVFAQRPRKVAELTFNLALAHEMLAYTDAAHRAPAREAFATVVASEADAELRVRAGTALVRLALEARELGDAARHLDEVEREVEQGEASIGELSSYARAGLVTARARLARLTGAGRVALERSARELARAGDEVLEDLAREPLRPGGVGVMRYRVYRQVFGEEIEHRLALGDVEGAFEVVLRCHGVATLDRALGAAPATVAALRAELGDAVLVTYFLWETGTHVFALDREALVHGVTPNAFELRERVASFRGRLQGPVPAESDRERLESLGRELADDVFPGAVAARVARASTVLVVGRDQADGLPFEALAGERAPLGVEKALGYWPTPGSALELARRHAAAFPFAGSDDLHLVGAARHGERVLREWPELEEVQLTRAEVAALERPFGRTRASLGDDATAAALAHAPRPLVLSILTHAVHDGSREMSRGLVLARPDPQTEADDGVLFPSEVTARHAAPLVELAACSSEQGPARVGDGGMATLTGAFLRAGSPGVLSTSRDASVDATIALLAAFHDELATGAPALESLRRARATLWNDGRDLRDVALVHAHGALHRPLFPPRERSSPFGAAVVLVAGLGVLVAVARTLAG